MNMDILSKTCVDIKSLRIQGAEHVTNAALSALLTVIRKSKADKRTKFLHEIETARQRLEHTRPVEPEMQNSLRFVLIALRTTTKKDIKTLKIVGEKKIWGLRTKRKETEKKIVKYAQDVIKEGMTIFTHCHSSTVVSALKEAAKKKHFSVYATETRPMFQGRITASELADAKIDVTQIIDSGAWMFLQKSSIVLIGADAFVKDGVYNKIGSGMIAELAEHRVPLYICASIWKILAGMEENEERPKAEVWANAKKNIKIKNTAFEKIPYDLITGIICEEGIIKPTTFRRQREHMLHNALKDAIIG